ncbi:calcium-activated chloride channel domain-containing protein [Trichoderma chlorosporum]
MSSLRGLYGKGEDQGGEGNFGVDFVIHYRIPPKERAKAEAGFVQLIEALTNIGLTSTVRCCDKNSLLVFTRLASNDLLARQVYSSRLQDWLQGVRLSGPGSDVTQAIKDEPVTEAERLRLVYLLITNSRNDGGAGITQGQGQWKYVDAIFPLHNNAFNKEWLQKWSKKYILDQSDLDDIRDKFGEGVAFYFAFLKDYFSFQIFPAVIGLSAWMLLGQFSTFYAICNCLWSVVFFEYWKRKEADLSINWGVRGVSKIQHQRPEFRWDFETEDMTTGEPIKVYAPIKRLQTQLLQIPFALACVVVLGGLVAIVNSLEIFINEVYAGPGKQWLGFVPSILLSTLTPTFSTILMSAAKKLTDKENYDTMDAHHAALVQKQFVLNFMTSYMALTFTAFVYIPFGSILQPFLNFWGKTAQTLTMSEVPLTTRQFEANPQRIANQMYYTTVTAQIINTLTEVVVPYVKHKASVKAKELSSKDNVKSNDQPEEAEFLKRVRNQVGLEIYDVTADYREMVMQYGYLSLFSVSWPLTACFFLLNNWVELRSDALKIVIGCRRPIPWRADSIGPWLTALGFLSWLGSVTSAAIVYLCSSDRQDGSVSYITAGGVLLSILLAEHLYFAAQLAVRFVMGKVESSGLQRERKERFQMRKKLLEETVGHVASEKATIEVPGVETTEKITRQTLEEEARLASIHGHGSPEEMFWQRQRGMQDTILVGRKLIEEQSSGKS